MNRSFQGSQHQSMTRSFSKPTTLPGGQVELNDHALQKQMREINSVIEESKQVIDDENDLSDLDDDYSNSNNEVSDIKQHMQ